MTTYKGLITSAASYILSTSGYTVGMWTTELSRTAALHNAINTVP